MLIRGLINDAVSSSYCIGLQLQVTGWLVWTELERMRKEGIVAEFEVTPPPPRYVHRDEENSEKLYDKRSPDRYRNSGSPNMRAC